MTARRTTGRAQPGVLFRLVVALLLLRFAAPGPVCLDCADARLAADTAICASGGAHPHNPGQNGNDRCGDCIGMGCHAGFFVLPEGPSVDRVTSWIERQTATRTALYVAGQPVHAFKARGPPALV